MNQSTLLLHLDDSPACINRTALAIDLARRHACHLTGHGVRVTRAIESTEIDVGNALLSRAADRDVDLLVMGAYSHARWAERILGGVTRTVLSTMTVPVLMSR